MSKQSLQPVTSGLIRAAGVLLALAVLCATGIGSYYLVILLLSLAALNPTVTTAFVTGAVTIVASVSAVVVGRYFEKRREVEAAFRERRLQAYERFISKFAEITGETQSQPDDLVRFLRQLNKEILLWAGPHLLKAYSIFLSAASDGAAGKTFFLLEDFYRAMREDLGHSNTGLKRGDILRLILKSEDLSTLLAGMEKDPNFRITLPKK